MHDHDEHGGVSRRRVLECVTWPFTFTAAGDYTYFCSLHPHMTGTIKVE